MSLGKMAKTGQKRQHFVTLHKGDSHFTALLLFDLGNFGELSQSLENVKKIRSSLISVYAI